MKRRMILTGAVLTCGAFLPGVAVHATSAPQGAILMAADDSDKDKDKNKTNHDQHAPAPSGHTAPPANHMSGSPMTGHNPPGGGTMGGHNMMGGHNAMSASHGNFDRHAFQRNVTASRHFHVSVYVRPQGWYDHHWGYGEILPAFFWAQNYWLNNYADYGLDVPPPGFVWVRDGDDALLVDTSSGEILQVDYGVFD
jgi:Ni/Co efflux regulator RcnB